VSVYTCTMERIVSERRVRPSYRGRCRGATGPGNPSVLTLGHQHALLIPTGSTRTNTIYSYQHGLLTTPFHHDGPGPALRCQPSGDEVLFVRPDAVFDRTKPISGGIPLCFPQFGPGKMQQHGFARWAAAS